MLEFTTENLLQYLVRLMIIFLIMPVHEFAHAWTADKLGDYTAKYQGRLTISPFAHVDLFGSILLFFFGFGWAKPVPVNPIHFKKPRLGMMLTALAGPVSNLICALIGLIAYRAMVCTLEMTDSVYYVTLMAYYFVVLNVNLAVFNLLPVPPLDGSKILSYFLPAKADRWIAQNQMTFYVIMMVLLATPILRVPMDLLSGLMLRLLNLLTAWVPLVLG